MSKHRIRARDEGMRKISQLTRWTLAGCAGLTGLFSVMAASSDAGHSKSTSADSTAESSSSSSSSSGLQSSSTPVSSSSGSAQVSSGGS